MDYLNQLKNLLGPDGFASYQEYQNTIPGQTVVSLLNQQLTDNSLAAEQSAQLVQVVKNEPYQATHGIGGDLDPAFLGSQDVVDAHLQQVLNANQQILQQSASFLTSNQLSTLAVVLSNSVNSQKTQAAALVPKH